MRGARFGLAAAVALGVAIQAQSFDVYFHHDDYVLLEGMSRAPSLWRWLVAPHNEHFMLVPKALYALFFRLAGPSALPWHALILALHAASCSMLAALLGRVGLSDTARIFAVGSFAVSTVYHESIYWIAASNGTVALAFGLGAILALARFDEGRGARWFAAAVALSCVALCSWMTAVAFVVLAPAAGLAMRWRAGHPARTLFVFAAAPGLAVLAFFVATRALGVTSATSSAQSSFQPIAGSVLAARSIVERLAARFFTGGTLLPPAAALVLAAIVAAALGRRAGAGGPSRAISFGAPVAWIVASTWIVFPFRAWLGEVAFLARYELFPAVGFAWLVALAVDGVLERARRRPHGLGRALATGLLAGVLPLVFAAQGYASRVCHERWLARTEPLRLAHVEIARGLSALVGAARAGGRPYAVLRDHAVGGGVGYRPTLSGMSCYLLAEDVRAGLRISGDPGAVDDPLLAPLVEDLRRGRRSWIVWLDDLSVETGRPAPLAGPRLVTLRLEGRALSEPRGGERRAARVWRPPHPTGRAEPARAPLERAARGCRRLAGDLVHGAGRAGGRSAAHLQRPDPPRHGLRRAVPRAGRGSPGPGDGRRRARDARRRGAGARGRASDPERERGVRRGRLRGRPAGPIASARPRGTDPVIVRWLAAFLR